MVEKWKKGSFYEFMIHIKEGPHTVLFMVGESVNNIMILNKKEINLLISLFTYFSKFVFLLFYLSQKKWKFWKDRNILIIWIVIFFLQF